jgi:ATP-dependent Clp protease adaptor protein ClpS
MGTGTIILTEEQTETRSGYYPKWKVIIHNDNKTTMDFVVEVLMRFFNKEYASAMKLMLQVHEQGYGIAGVYSKEQAEFRIEQATSMARGRNYPLTLTMEEV